MRIFSTIRSFTFALIAVVLASGAWGAGITVPSGSTLNVNTCTLNVCGDVTNAGTLQTTTGTISLIGNWVNSGTFTSNNGTVTFNATSGVQTLNTGGIANAFYNLTHNAAGTVQVITNLVDINNNFSNSSGPFDANSLNMTVGKNWTNSNTFTPGTNTVTLDGSSQAINGTTTFYDLTKITAATDTLTLADTTASPVGQTITHKLTLQGASSNLLSLRSSTNLTYAKISLQVGGAQSMQYLDVKDSDASGGLQLVAGTSSVDTGPQANLNWSFANSSIIWDGSESVDWDDPFNWDLGLVPAPGDTVTITPLGAGVLFQPRLTTNVSIGNLTIQAAATLTLNGKNLIVTSTLDNAATGTITLRGTETVEIQTIDSNSGTFIYTGTGAAASFAMKITDPTTHVELANEYFNLTIADPTNLGTFARTANLGVLGALTITGGNLDISNRALTIAGNTAISAGTLTATNGTIDANGAVAISGTGTLIAPSSTLSTAFTVAGDWSNSATFTHSNGKVTFNGASQAINGSSTFYKFEDTTAAATLTFNTAGTQTFTNDLTLTGGSGVGGLINIRSSLAGTAANIALTAGGTQAINYVDVQDSNASGGLELIARNSPDHSVFLTYNNTNWAFGATTFIWDGSTDTNWDIASNWNKGLVPSLIDTVTIANAGSQPATLATNVTVYDLTIQAGATVSLAGKNLTVTNALDNAATGTVTLRGTETVEIKTIDSNSGKFIYTGTGAAASFAMKITDPTTHVELANEYFDLTIADSSNLGTFARTANLGVLGALTITGGNLDMSNKSLTIAGNTAISAGTLTATNGTIDANGAVAISGTGTLIAPSSTLSTAFTVAGDWSNSATFTHSNGKVTFNGASQAINGSSTFYKFEDTTAAATLTFNTAGTQTFANDLTLTGGSGVGGLINIRSSLAGTAANIALTAGATQAINYVDVQDSNASGGLLLVGRNSPDHSVFVTYNNTNWVFGTATYIWDGSTNTNWDTASNWNLGLVPASIDTADIANAGSQPATLATNVTVYNLTVRAGATVSLDGKNLTVTNALDNEATGTVTLKGTETVEIQTIDSNSGTFIYTGTGAAASFAMKITDPTTHVELANEYFNLTIADPTNLGTFARSANLGVLGALTITGGNLDISTTPNKTLTVAGNTAISAGTLTATNGNIDANGSVALSGTGILVAPTTAKTFTVAGDWSKTAGATFTHSSGTVTLDTTTTVLITGDTTFYDLTSTAAGKQINFAVGSNQTVNHTWTLIGTRASAITLRAAAVGSWGITFPNGSQRVSAVNVKDSNAFTNTVTCLNCTDATGNNANWIFVTLVITAPDNVRTVGKTPTIIGEGVPDTNLTIKDTSNNVVATTRVDANGNFRVAVGNDNDTDGSTSVVSGTQLALGANALTPYWDVTPGYQNDLTVVASPTAAQVPTITSPTNAQKIHGSKPTIIGTGQASQPVIIVANDAAGNLLLSTVGSGTLDGSGIYSITLTTALPKNINYLSATVDGVASDLIYVTLTDPFGVVFDSTTNKLIKNAVVTIYNSSGNVAQPGVDLDAADTNPYTTSDDGFYSFLAASGNYSIKVAATGYTYPSTLTNFPSGRTIVTGSKGEGFAVGAIVIEMDHPVDGNAFLLRIEKSANKSEAKIGEVVTYTITIQNLSGSNIVNNILLEDRIPPGFKYLPNRVLLDGVPLSEPAGQRPLVFSIGTIGIGQTMTLKYQLVVGSGVTSGSYENTAAARYDNGVIISNNATSTVKVILDPLFDLGTVIGKVFYDLNENGAQDAPEYDPTESVTIVEKPVPNVQIVTEDGAVITADNEGKFSVPGLLPGRHILRLNERTLPPGTFLTTEKAVIVDVTPGSISKVNFGVNADSEQIVGKDAQFFNEQIHMTQDQDKPMLRLSAAMFNPSAETGEGETIVLYDAAFLTPVEFRMFTNYSPFIETWRLDIFDQDTKKRIKRFEGGRLNIHDPLFWNGRGDDDKIVRSDHKYSYTLTVLDDKGRFDVTGEKPIKLRIIKDEDEYKRELEKQKEKEVIAAHVDNYSKWYSAQKDVNNIQRQMIPIDGETLRIDPQGRDIKAMRVLKDGAVFAEVPVGQNTGILPKDLLSGYTPATGQGNVEVVLPKGDYTVEIIGPKASTDLAVLPAAEPTTPSVVPASSLGIVPSPNATDRYTRKVKVGDDYMMFVGLGDAKVGYTFNRGNVEPVQSNDQFQGGFWREGKAAYYLKGKIKGKYLVTSSFDTNREQKALFRTLDPNSYYPLYGDKSSINYDATNTQGPLYLLVEWDKSSAIWGNYALDFKDTEFSSFSRTYYGGKIDYQSVAANPYGDARTKMVVFHAEIQQKPSHNEFLGTGGSLYFLKHKEVIEGSDKIRLEVRDRVTGLVIASKDMKNGSDYELDDSQGRILFWQPVAMIAKAESIVSSALLDGNPVYVIADYEYAVKDKLLESSEGGRFAQGVGDNVVVGGTYVKETQASKNYELKGTDATVHLGPDATIKAELATTRASGGNTYVSTDGGITFTDLTIGNTASGSAYGIKGDARLFDRLGLSSYYRWVSNDFASTDSTSQGGKQTAGMALVFDMTPVTRLTVRKDIQKLIQDGNLQTQVQVGASETSTTMVQIVHEAARLTLTGEYQLTEVKEQIDGLETATNQQGAVVAGKAEYALTERINVSLAQQIDLIDTAKKATTLGVQAQVTDKLSLRAQETFTEEGTAASVGITQGVTDKLSLNSDYTVATFKSGEVSKTASIGFAEKFNENISAFGALAMTDSTSNGKTTSGSFGTNAKVSDAMSLASSLGQNKDAQGNATNSGNVSGSFGTKAKITDATSLDIAVGQDRALDGSFKNVASVSAATQFDKDSGLTTTYKTGTDRDNGAVKSLTVDATRKVNDKTSSSSTVQVDEDALGVKTTTVSYTDNTKINDQLQAVSQRSYGVTPDGTKQDSKYAVQRDKDGRLLEGSLTRQLSQEPGGVSQSNIYGLSGDVNDRLAVQGTIEKGRVQNLDGTTTGRTAFTLGTGYVLKDTETAVERLTNSTKIELRLDKSVEDSRQFVFYNSLEGKVTDNASVSAKFQYDKTENTTTNQVLARHKEIILGAAYRPVNYDRLNLIGQYTYKEGVGPSGQINAASTDVAATRAQVFAGEAVYDVNENWQLAEKFAYRINDEKVAGFEFNRTHTWLMIHRLNYRVDRNWQLSGEYRRLTQVEAKDSKQGLLLEATRNINDSAQLGIGWNFTQFNDDLTALNYTSQGPFLRMTGKMYDRTPEEKARARAKWLDERVSEWAWGMVKKELAKPDSKIAAELNNMFILAQQAQKANRLEEAKQIYKDIIMAGQMMFDEAAQYIRSKIAFEEKLQEYDKTAQDYFKGGEYIKARKLWEKIVEDAQNRVLQ